MIKKKSSSPWVGGGKNFKAFSQRTPHPTSRIKKFPVSAELTFLGVNSAELKS